MEQELADLKREKERKQQLQRARHKRYFLNEPPAKRKIRLEKNRQYKINRRKNQKIAKNNENISCGKFFILYFKIWISFFIIFFTKI